MNEMTLSSRHRIRQELRTYFFELDAVHGLMIEACPTYICVFGNSGYCQILDQDFLLMQIDLCLDP